MLDYVLAKSGEVTELIQPGSTISGVAIRAGQRVPHLDVPATGERGFNLKISSERGIAGHVRCPTRSRDERHAEGFGISRSREGRCASGNRSCLAQSGRESCSCCASDSNRWCPE
jgi:hypothetical protein